MDIYFVCLDGLKLYPNDRELREQNNNVTYVTRQMENIDMTINEISQKYNSLYEHILKPKNNNGNNSNNNNNNNNSNNNNNDSKTDNSDEKSQEISENGETTHLLSDDDKTTLTQLMRLIEDIEAKHMSKALDLKCLKVKALIVKQDYDNALSQATILLRADANHVPSIKVLWLCFVFDLIILAHF